MPYRVSLDAIAKDLRRGRLPAQVRTALMAWVDAVQQDGLPETRKVPGYHDEPIAGRTDGARSVRLNRQWRLFYIEKDGAATVLVVVQKVTPHDYRTRK